MDSATEENNQPTNDNEDLKANLNASDAQLQDAWTTEDLSNEPFLESLRRCERLLTYLRTRVDFMVSSDEAMERGDRAAVNAIRRRRDEHEAQSEFAGPPAEQAISSDSKQGVNEGAAWSMATETHRAHEHYAGS
ncbi:uncharacterized protein LTR77_000596 [Saxophila tyrrhenica]|uniref:Uncharacterized protein n=1 Tax=Saxophila tyrrhenica TaxID=1690608 RepID=A0AAV9PNR5_9PEZI|nr:hypothetical protein LTR77_000596 [Saxophila tyrrhenica]